MNDAAFDGERPARNALAADPDVLAVTEGREALGLGGKDRIEKPAYVGFRRRECLSIRGLDRIQPIAAHEFLQVTRERCGGVEKLQADRAPVDCHYGASLLRRGTESGDVVLDFAPTAL